MKKAEDSKDETKIAELNRLKVDYEQLVRCGPFGSPRGRKRELTIPVCFQIMAFVDECDRRIRAAQRRLEKTPEENNRTTALVRITVTTLLVAPVLTFVV